MADKKKLNLALQGGGSHGAFTWGVLDRLMEAEADGADFVIEGISGTSAGAMNGAVFTLGYERGGPQGARDLLETFWRKVSDQAQFSPIQRTVFDGLFGHPWNMDHSPTYMAFDIATRAFSPYQTNPLNWHPLREVLRSVLEPGQLRRCKKVKLFVSATNVRTGKNKVFQGTELSIDCLLASACLPFLFQTIVIEGEGYWDGGYMGNPALYPLIYHCDSEDIAVVQINPMIRDEIPKTAAEIADRVNEISFNSTLVRELRAIAFVQDLIREERLDTQKYKDIKIHWIGAETEMRGLGVSSKINAEWEFLEYLKGVGRTAAEDWLDGCYGKVGTESSIDIQEIVG